MSDVDTVEVEKRKRGPITRNPFLVIARVTDANGNPIDNARVEVLTITKDIKKWVPVYRLHRTEPGFVDCEYLPTTD